MNPSTRNRIRWHIIILLLLLLLLFFSTILITSLSRRYRRLRRYLLTLRIKEFNQLRTILLRIVIYIHIPIYIQILTRRNSLIIIIVNTICIIINLLWLLLYY